MRLDPLFAVAAAAVWLGTGVLAGTLSHARTATSLRRRTRLLLIGVTAAGGASVLLTTPLLTAAAVVTLGFAVPRLVRLHRATSGFAAAGPGIPVPPALRAAAAHPAVVVAVQAMAYVSLAAPLLSSSLAAPLTPALALMLAGTLHGYAARHRGLAAGALLPHARPVPLPGPGRVTERSALSVR